MLPLLVSLLLAQAVPSPTAPAASPPAVAIGPRVVLETTLGNVVLGLYREKSPLSVENFLRYVRSGHYDGTVFHRVIPGFMIQGGGLDAQLVEKPTRAPVRNEARNGLRNLRGTLAMARTSDPDSATSQFFINLKTNAPLDFGIGGAGYAVFGEVIEGMDVVDAIAAVRTKRSGPHADVPVTAVVIRRARVLDDAAPKASPAPKPSPVAQPSPKPKPSADAAGRGAPQGRDTPRD